MNNEIKITLLYFLLIISSLTCVNGQTGTEPKRYDIIISEIMADPTPTIGLPPAEYVELHNRLPYSVTLENWMLKIGNTLKTLPTITIDSAGFTILIAEKFYDSFVDMVPTCYTLSSLSLTDAGQTLILYNSYNEVIHSVTYKKSWHPESIKQDGGWSLEMIEEDLPCLGQQNWTSSLDPKGGTPASPNSIHSPIKDEQHPVIERITLLDSTTIRLFFTEPIYVDLPIDSVLFDIYPPIEIRTIQEVPHTFRALDIYLLEVPSSNTIYTLTIQGRISDCAGNRASIGDAIQFGVPRNPSAKDLIINEILTNSAQGEEADYIEIYNRSASIIDMKDIKIGSGGDTLPEKAVFAVSDGYQLLPYHYFVLCKNRTLTEAQYYCPDTKALWQCDSLPAYAIGSGVVHLTNRSLQSIDKLAYTEAMHYAPLSTTEGISLERIHIDGRTQDANNWRSAAASAGFGTPGYVNSQAGEMPETEEISIIPQVFSPDNDGYNDYTELAVSFADLENRLTITIYNEHGLTVNHLVNNEICGTNAAYRWDGLDDHNARLPPGFYIVLLKWWNLNGKVQSCKKVVAIAAS